MANGGGGGGGRHYSVSTGLSDPGSLRVQQGRARLCSPLALGRGSEQTQSGPLSSSGVEKCREAVEEAPGHGNVPGQKEQLRATGG